MKKRITNDGQPVDAGSAPVNGPTTPRSSTIDDTARDGGSPPAWLVDGIAAAGGLMSAPSTPRSGGAARNAGGPPGR
ncbi:hypothetical protein [Micromonospora sp. CPCC 206061]|uniref:hypothetical protein n=1 Tax=Micromonospora sp. CPCC 206061 TaxID=3122410 RepID=UPI002FF3DD17